MLQQIIIILMQQQDPYSFLKINLQNTIQSINCHTDNLNKTFEDLIKKYATAPLQYPLRSFIFFLNKEFIPKLNNRVNLKICFTSDIFILYAHRFVAFIYQIQKYIANIDEKTRKEAIRGSSSNTRLSGVGTSAVDLMQEIGVENNIENILRIPSSFIKRFIFNQMNKSIKSCQDHSVIVQRNSLNLFLQVFNKQTDLVYLMKQPDLTKELIEDRVKISFFTNVGNANKYAKKFSHRILFLAKLKMRVKKANKRINQRKMRIQELIDGERKYVQGLKDYIQYIKKPIEASGLINKNQELILFSTVEPIMALHSHFYKQLSNHFNNYSKDQTYGDILTRNFPYFKIYNDYILYADQAQALLLKLSDQHQQIQDICKKFMDQKQKKASDQLKQPTFRIARYQMILKEIIKNTNEIHLDYKKLMEAQKVGISVLRKINENVDATCRRNRLNQIQTMFGTVDRPIYMEKREFFEQFAIFYIHQDKQEPVTVFVFNDIVLVTQVEAKKIIKWIKIDQNFYVRRQEDNKTYKNIIKLHSDGFITFSAGSEEKHIKKAETFFDLLQKVSKENEQNTKMVYVQVIGTEQIGSTSFAKHTEYVVEIKYFGLRKLVHLRFSQMQPLVKRAQEHYGNNLNISHEQALKKNWFNNHKSKTIEDRKRTIQQILQKILNHQQVKKDPGFILEQLKIQKTFFKKTEEYRKKKQAQRQSQSITQVLQKSSTFQKMDSMLISKSVFTSKVKKREHKEAETILCATQIKLGRDLYHHDAEDMQIDPKKFEAEKIEIQIYTMFEQEPKRIFITEFHTVQDICHKMSKIIGLRMNRDFRLFHEIGKKELRMLDQQQKLMKIFSFSKIQRRIGVVSQFFGSIKKIITPETEPNLIFKKYYFLPIEIEQSECRKDLTRLRLLVYQVFSEIKEMKYQLSFDEYLLFLAMLIYIEYEGTVPEEVPQSFVKRLIPDTIFKLKNYTESQWIDKSRAHINRLGEEIEKIILYNRDQLKQKKIKIDSISKTSLHFGHRHLCSQIVLNKIKLNPIFGSNLFYVQPYKKTFEELSEDGHKMAYNMWLAIKVEGLHLLTPSSKQTVLQLRYKDIEKIFVYSESIIFKMESLQTCEYRFNTYQSFEISQLVKYNKCLNQTLLELERNQDLIMRARMYKQQSLIYRNTNENSQIGISKSVRQ